MNASNPSLLFAVLAAAILAVTIAIALTDPQPAAACLSIALDAVKCAKGL